MTTIRGTKSGAGHIVGPGGLDASGIAAWRAWAFGSVARGLGPAQRRRIKTAPFAAKSSTVH